MEKREFAAVFDFDRTLTPPNTISLYWLIEQDQRMPKSFKEKTSELRKKYLQKALKGQLNRKDEEDWFLETIGNYIKHGINLNLIKEILSNTPLREGVRETFEFLRQNNVPIAIISYGVFDFIKIVLENHDLIKYVDQIYAVRLITDEEGKITGYEDKNLVYPYNKGLFSLRFAQKHGILRENILAVGDSGGDANLGYLKENRFGLASNREEDEQLKGIMGKVIITDDFYPVLSWIKNKVNEPARFPLD